MTITVRNLVKAFGADARVVDDVSFAIAPGEMFFLLGPSGCGKTTVLRMLAGFLEPDAGEILFDARKMNGVAPQNRNTAMVFQNYAIWPHLTVFENVAYGPRARKLSPSEIDKRVAEALRVARLGDLAQRKPAQLSGGQQQRVALARALAVDPGLILLDEPLSNLDARLRLELRGELKRIHGETRTTCLYVTHDQEEALSLADRIAVMNRGRIEQVGTPRDIYEKPANEFTARFMGELNVVAAESPLAAALRGPERRRIGFRPESARLDGDGIAATVRHATYLGSKTELLVAVATGETLKLWTAGMAAAGETVRFSVPTEKLILL
ncbi:MAG TPA: ABC transporter ATP-binding protein [Candidatus Methylacidiphilales bacterium]|jgi:ABC-type Fe3+/spermidine/putrescine transport system ATPase subunit|nr:ABC transporter ATP-binding protein [Candidatus Methylacidiphilales bacterium]